MTSHEEILKTLAAEEALLTLPRPVHADFSFLTFDSLKIFFKLSRSRSVHANFSFSTFDSLKIFLKLSRSRSVHTDFFFGHQHLNIFDCFAHKNLQKEQLSSLSILQFFQFLKTPTSNSSFVRNSDQSFRIRTNRSEFGPIQNSDQSNIQTNRSEFVPVDRNSNQSRKIRTNHFFRIWTFFSILQFSSG